ncbi:hypothetical protein LOD99_7467 [Oopsacas minuta]|uniref:Uncharacterized protein n=1 Tax=Oopsacas minuta TaxID=111878 RepID=A0AAV7JTY5_9METZ|nr:hypothetical protein LOD99_7467 [Oopsacas minuta]
MHRGKKGHWLLYSRDTGSDPTKWSIGNKVSVVSSPQHICHKTSVLINTSFIGIPFEALFETCAKPSVVDVNTVRNNGLQLIRHESKVFGLGIESVKCISLLEHPEEGFCQRALDNFLRDSRGILSFVDDIIKHARTPEEHLDNFDRTLSDLERNDVELRGDDCKFGIEELEFLDHLVSRSGRRPLLGTIRKIKDCKQPTCKNDDLRFLRLITLVPRVHTTNIPKKLNH